MKLALGSTKLIDVALKVATEAHKNQKRWDNSPYINHPIAVAEKVASKYKEACYTILFRENYYNCLVLSSLAHDICEDCDGWLNAEEELVNHIEKVYGASIEYKQDIVSALFNLNKHRHDGYLEFILNAKNNEIARQVKIADITHNLSDLKKGSMRDKYELALWILKYD